MNYIFEFYFIKIISSKMIKYFYMVFNHDQQCMAKLLQAQEFYEIYELYKI